MAYFSHEQKKAKIKNRGNILTQYLFLKLIEIIENPCENKYCITSDPSLLNKIYGLSKNLFNFYCFYDNFFFLPS